MAKVSGLNVETVRRLRGVVDFYYWKSILVARKWPETGKKGWSDRQYAARAAFKKSRAAMASQGDNVKDFWRFFARNKPETWPAVFTRWYMEYWKETGRVPPVMTNLTASRASPSLKIDFEMCGIDAVNVCVVYGQSVPAAVQYVPGKSCGQKKYVIKPGPSVCFPATKIPNVLYDGDAGSKYQGGGYISYGTAGSTWPELFAHAWQKMDTVPDHSYSPASCHQLAKKEDFEGSDRAVVSAGWQDIFWYADDYVAAFGLVAPDFLRVWVNPTPLVGLDGTVREGRAGLTHDMSLTPDWWDLTGVLKMPVWIGGHFSWYSRFNVVPYPEHYVPNLGYEQRVGFVWDGTADMRVKAFGPDTCQWTVTIPESALSGLDPMLVFKDSDGILLPDPPIQNQSVV